VAAPYLASFAISHAMRIIGALSEWPEIARAARMYPSIVTTREHGSRFVACFMPMALLAVSYFGEGAEVTRFGLIGFLLLVIVPYGGLWGWYLRQPLDASA